ncbi:hypothetical protein [Leptospira inadai]|uniref:Ribbon-helix-helix protein, CopG family n=1 Tax=Leptospira inadai serovar Lyme TaxID=293084 RepID=A0ABX4YDC1_9LEPT|nr:hypothetical protein [Leptospira inadai]PNV72122.1 hypothetical protein BES34_020035 [Leptospira inadai serovar Lyme]
MTEPKKKPAPKKGRPKVTTEPTRKATYSIPESLYSKLIDDARVSKRSIAQQLIFILEEYFKGKR